MPAIKILLSEFFMELSEEQQELVAGSASRKTQSSYSHKTEYSYSDEPRKRESVNPFDELLRPFPGGLTDSTASLVLPDLNF